MQKGTFILVEMKNKVIPSSAKDLTNFQKYLPKSLQIPY